MSGCGDGFAFARRRADLGANFNGNRRTRMGTTMSENDSISSPRPRGIKEILAARPTIEGAGVHLHRAFGAAEVPRLDPFLLLDDFRSENPAEYVAGFPWHPPRGSRTGSHQLDGRAGHGDDLRDERAHRCRDV